MNKQYKTKMPWFRFYTADYVTATVNLSTVERAIWLDLLRLFWEHGSLPDDLDKIRVNMLPLGRSRAYKLVSGVLEKCFERNDGRWFNPDFGDHHLKVGALSSQSPTLLCQTQPNFDPTLPNLDPTLRNLAKTRPWDGKKCSDINAPESLEQNRTKNKTKNTAKGKEQNTQTALPSTEFETAGEGDETHDICNEVNGRDTLDTRSEANGRGDDSNPTPDPNGGGGESIVPTPAPEGDGDDHDVPWLATVDNDPPVLEPLYPYSEDDDVATTDIAYQVVYDMDRLFKALQTARPEQHLPAVIEQARQFLNTRKPEQIKQLSKTKASENGQMNFCEALFDGHDRKTADIDNLHYYLFGRLDSATDPVILAVAVGLWVQDGNPFPEPNAVQRCLLRTRQILDSFLAQLDRMDYYLEKAEEIMDLYHGMQDCAPEIEYHEREMQRRPLAN